MKTAKKWVAPNEKRSDKIENNELAINRTSYGT
jgi:hypothetical protein